MYIEILWYIAWRRSRKKTGLDVRVFEDAMTFKIALMVEKHMRAMKEKEHSSEDAI